MRNIFSNALIFDAEGKIIGYRVPPITSVTKSIEKFSETEQAQFSHIEAALIIGDVIDDAYMIPQQNLKATFKIGILNNYERVSFADSIG